MKKIVSALLIFALFSGTIAYAYNLPEPDWGALLKEKTAMVMEEDFELFVEGSTENALYYGAKFEPESGVYIGMTCDTADEYLPLGSYLTYIESYYQGDLYYPSNAMIASDNVITMVGFNTDSIYGVDYDAINRTLDTLNSYGKPMLIRFANEMNCSELGDDPDLYVEVFRTVADMIHQYPNLAVVWSPNDIGALDKLFEYYYPGDEYVDWIGVSCYMKRYFNNNPNTSYKDSIYFMMGDFSWATNRVKPVIKFMEQHNINKPLMLSEGGVSTHNTFGDSYESMAEWNVPRMRNLYWDLIMKYPQIKMINYFNVDRAYETEKYDITPYPYASEIFKEAKESGAYLKSLNGTPEFVYTKAEKGGNLKAKNGVVALYTLAYIPQNPDITVNYKIDGTWFHSSNQIPYKCNFDINSISDGKHTLTIEAAGLSKSYTLYKNGQYMSFNDMPDVPESTAADNKIGVYIRSGANTEKLDLDQPPVIKNDRTMLPIRFIAEALGAEVIWDGENRIVTIKSGSTVIEITIDKDTALANGRNIALDAPAFISGGRTYLPLRFVSENLGAEVEWNGDLRQVIISK